MSTTSFNLTRLITAEEFAAMTGIEEPAELVRGRVVVSEFHGFLHGHVCASIACALLSHLSVNDLGQGVVGCGVMTRRDPDSVRGPDVAFYSYDRVPRGKVPVGWPQLPPELVFEVLSPDDRWKDIIDKTAEYLTVGVSIVCIVDPHARTIHAFRPDEPVAVFGADDHMNFAPALPGWNVQVRRFFERK